MQSAGAESAATLMNCMATLCDLIGRSYGRLPNEDVLDAWHTLQAAAIIYRCGESSPEQPIVLDHAFEIVHNVGGLKTTILIDSEPRSRQYLRVPDTGIEDLAKSSGSYTYIPDICNISRAYEESAQFGPATPARTFALHNEARFYSFTASGSPKGTPFGCDRPDAREDRRV
jgi:hypothetical protein